MNRISKYATTLQKSAILLLMLAVPVCTLGQKKGESKPSAPAKSAPAHSSGGASGGGSHGSTPTHSSTPSHSAATGHGATTGGTHTSATGHAAATGGTHTSATGHAATTGGTHTSATGHTATTSRTPATAHAATSTRTGSSASVSHTPPGKTVSLKGGGTASVRPNGSIRSINRNGMTIQHNVNGGRTVVSERNGARIVTTGRGGYVQRAYVVRGGRTFVSRTYVVGGVAHVGVYRSYYWGGRPYYGYYPGYWYHPGFYAWGYRPWGVGVYWGVGAWGWGGAPWWGYYGGWWNPYPVYASPAFWLTDYLIASSLQSAYAARADAHADEMAADAQASGGGGGDAAPAASNGVQLTPEVKEAIAEEVKAQLAAQQAQASAQGGGSAGAAPAPASGQVPPALDPAMRTFVVDTNVTGVGNGQECGLTGGDVLTRLTDTPDADQTVNVSVGASKKGDCPTGQTVAVKVDDLQEMYNHFQEQLNNGMGELAKKQGTGGIPAAPDTGTTASDVPPPAPDNTAAKALQDQQQAADQTETQVKQETASAGGGSQ